MKKRSAMTWWIILLLCVPVVYIGAQLAMLQIQSYPTETVVETTLAQTVECEGFLGMNETEILYDGVGLLGFSVQNGTRVAQGSVVAQAYESVQQAQSAAYAAALSREIESLQESDITIEGIDVEMLMRQSRTAANDYLDVVAHGNLTELGEAKAALATAAGKNALAIGSGADIAARIETLIAQRDAASAAGGGTAIATPIAGYFVAGRDSEKRVYTTQQLMDMSAADLQRAAQEPSVANERNVVGKIIENYSWRFFATITAQEAEQFSGRTNVSIAFPDVGDESLPATVEAVIIDEESGLAKLILQCNYINEQVVTLERARAVVTLQEYHGLRLDRRALRVVDGVKGAYIRYGNVARFCPISILFETENYLLCPLATEQGVNELARFDEAIISGRDLYDGKLL